MNRENYYIGFVKGGLVYVADFPEKLNSIPREFIADPISASHYPLEKLDFTSYEGKAIIISDNSGYQAQVIEVLEDKISKVLKDSLYQ
ncbi:hypothetical protein COL08_23005 [Priestia megaterium]|uniref:hypothetical protein n=1 Tax=Priestia megaterium TaxID=1404 RepID=UPI000BF76C5B|nr:hypothetical protein [Priestia megaterium]PFV93064.1 hypothetical protein COL08_23005 [Priestia megaterium]